MTDTPDDLAVILFNEIKRRQDAGETAISFDLLLKWLAALPPARIRDRNFEEWKALLPVRHAGVIEVFKSALEAGQTALKTLITINGGAAAALLAFLSSLVSKQPNPTLQASLSKALAVFVGGVALAGVSTAARYLTQFAAARNAESNYLTNKPSKGWMRAANTFIGVSIVSGLGSLAAFCIGGWLAYLALR
jgi:hypothetical protein